MTSQMIFFLQFVMSLATFTLVAMWFVGPWLQKLNPSTALSLLILPHATRHIGMSFLVPTLNGEGISQTFAFWAGYGDLAAAVLAFAALIALKLRSVMAIPLAWVFNITGTVDLLNAFYLAESSSNFGPTWFIPTFLVPLLLVTHVMIFIRLIKKTGVTAAV